MTTESDSLYRLVDALCTIDQIKDLLRSVKDRKGVRITAENKSDLIERNLREAVISGSLAVERVNELICNAEENGNQHVFYFKVRSKTLGESLTLDSMAKELWGANWQKKMSFPNMDTVRNGFVYSDFRLWNPTKKPRDWVLKVYGHAEYERFTGKEEEKGNKIYKEFEREDLRIVLLARWNSPDLLELRVQRDESRRRIKGWLNQLWVMLEKALQSGQFAPWDLSKTRRQMIEDEEKNQKIYNFRDTRLEDSMSNKASFETYAPQGNLFASIEAKKAIRDLLVAEESRCTHLSVNWLPSTSGVPPRELRTLLGDRESNDVIFPAQCSAAEMDYVTDQLRYFGR